MEDFVRKLALWHTKTFKPIMSHDELEPIMATLGFVALPATSSWREYAFSAAGCCRTSDPLPLPRVRLPYPRIDGLHIFSYRAFFDAVAFYLAKRDISDHFHVRGMPLHRAHDLPFDKKFRRMNDEEGLYVYREGTLDQVAKAYGNNNNSNNTTNSNSNDANSTSTLGCFVPLKDIIV